MISGFCYAKIQGAADTCAAINGNNRAKARQIKEGRIPMKKLFEEFKKFALRGNVIDLAVGVMIGGAFSAIVTSLVNDVFMPVLSLLTGGLNTSSLFIALGAGDFATIEDAAAAGVATINYGNFIQQIIDFVLIALCIFVFVKLISKLHKKEEEAPAPAPRLCPFCCQPVDEKATRCPHCTSELPAEDK